MHSNLSSCATETYYIKQITTNSEFMDFIKFTRLIYQEDQNWVEPLYMDVKYNLKKSPFWKHANSQLFMAYEITTNRPVGRIAAIIDHNFNSFHSEQTGFFGFFEAYNNVEVTKLLFTSVTSWLQNQGMRKLLGPFSPSSNEVSGFLCEGFNEPPKFMMPYNPPYYLDLMSNIGLVKCKQLYAYDLDEQGIINYLPKIKSIDKRLRRNLPEFDIRSLNMKDFDNEINHIVEIYNQAWDKNWGFVPWTTEEFKSGLHELKFLLVSDLILFATLDSKPIGLIMSFPDYNMLIKKMHGRILPFNFLKFFLNKKEITDVRVLVMGVKKEYRNLGIDMALIKSTIINLQKHGYKRGEMSWILEDNYKVRKSIEWLGSKVYKKYQLYEADLTSWNI